MSRCTLPEPCRNPEHDHFDEEDQLLRCPFCGQPTHYDRRVEDYRHDDPELACWQTPAQADDHIVNAIPGHPMLWRCSCGLQGVFTEAPEEGARHTCPRDGAADDLMPVDGP